MAAECVGIDRREKPLLWPRWRRPRSSRIKSGLLSAPCCWALGGLEGGQDRRRAALPTIQPTTTRAIKQEGSASPCGIT
jgi:hypothetical protein